MKLQNISVLGEYDFRASIPGKIIINNSDSSKRIMTISEDEQLLWRNVVKVFDKNPSTLYDVIMKRVFFLKGEL